MSASLCTSPCLTASLCLSVCQFASAIFRLPVYLPVSIYQYLSICSVISVKVYRTLSIFLCLFVCLSVYSRLCLPVCLLPVSITVCPSLSINCTLDHLYLSICLFGVHVSICLCPSMPFCACTWLHVPLSVHSCLPMPVSVSLCPCLYAGACAVLLMVSSLFVCFCPSPVSGRLLVCTSVRLFLCLFV